FDPRPTSSVFPQRRPFSKELPEAKGGILPDRLVMAKPSFGGFAAGERAREQNEGDFAMPQQKDLKRLVRARMQKTGESYTTARLHLVRNVGRTLTPSAGRVGEPVPHDYAKLAGMSDEAVKKATGCTWKRWVTALDH